MQDYIPILRHGQNEQKVMEKIESDLANTTKTWADQSLIKPLLEIVDDDHLNSISSYSGVYEEVLVDFPRYLQARDNKHQQQVNKLISDCGGDPVRFFNNIQAGNFTPVLSGELDPIDYPTYKANLDRLQSEFERVGARLFVPVDKYSDKDKTTVKSIIDSLREQDLLMVDVVDIRNIDQGIRSNLEYIESLDNNSKKYILDLFEPREDINYNYSLVMSKYLDFDGFGDFCLEPRFPDDIPPAAFVNIPKRVRQYKSNSHSVSTYEDPDRYLQVIKQMISRGTLDPNHCPFCHRLHDRYQNVSSNPNRKDLDNSFVKRARMGHYQFSLLQNEITDLDAASDAQDFDANGYDDISP